MYMKRIKEFIKEVLIYYVKSAKTINMLNIYDRGNTIFMYGNY